MKRTAQLLTYALMLTPSSAFADAITGAPAPAVTSYSDAAQAAQSQSNNSSQGPAVLADGAPLFDASGASLLLMSPPQFLFVGAHSKLRGGGDAGGGSNGGGSLIPGGVLNGLASGVSSGTLGNVGFNTLDLATAVAPIANPEPASLVLLGTGLVFCARQLRRRRA